MAESAHERTASRIQSDWATLDSCAVSDALDRLGYAGVIPGIVPLATPTTLIGRAVTVELGPVGSSPSTRHLGTAAIECAVPGDIIVVAHRGRLDCAGWGGTLSLAAKLAGVAGVIVDGACRDIPEAASLQFPVYGRGPTPRTARGRVREVSYEEPVTFGDLIVNPGDLVIADASGVVFVDQELESEVMGVALEISVKESAMSSSLRLGAPVSEVMGSEYERLTRPAQ